MSKLSSDERKQCQTLLKQVKARSDAGPFLEPVDWKAFNLPDYPSIIKNPMDLGTITKRLSSGTYKTVDQFASDVRLVWRNAKTYNRSDSQIYHVAEQMSKFFDKKFGTTFRGKGTKRKRESSGEVTRADRVKFSEVVNKLTSAQLGTLVSMIQKQCPGALREEDDDELEIEINKIEGTVLHQLITFAQECIEQGTPNPKKRA